MRYNLICREHTLQSLDSYLPEIVMAVTMYKYECATCATGFESVSRTARFCCRSCSGKNARRASSKQTCECGAPASRKGWCPACSKKRKQESRRRAADIHAAQWQAARRQKYAADADARAKVRDLTTQNRFNGNRDAALQRDGYRCRHCGTDQKLVVHHEKRRQDRYKKDAVSQIEDLLTLCRSCHINLHRAAGDLEPPTKAP